MDAFQPIRDIAARLHGELVADGIDPWRPSALIEAAVSKLGLEIAWLPPTDPALKGARASYDDQSGLICCEDVGSDAQRAMLAAHEIGHAKFHGATCDCVSEDIDVSRSTEAAPVGLQRVEDYGVRERQELQANVFAREFLLPRPWARFLYLDQAMSASGIAERTGLSKDVVRQQLLDALLLPELPTLENDEAAAIPAGILAPDSSQDRASIHLGSAFQLQAGPGTGKTRTLVKRVEFLIGQGVDPSTIVVLTFSNRAAGEISERLSRAAQTSVEKLWIGTFHAFGLDLVRRYHDRLGLPANPVLFDRSDAISVLEEILPTLPLVHYRNLWDPTIVLRDIVGAISRAKDELVDHHRYQILSQTMLAEAGSDADAREAAEKCLEVAHVYALYEHALREREAVDFGDLIMRPTLLLETDASVCQTIRARHRHVLVDEYQDVNRASARLLRSIAGQGDHLWVVGDARQSIYRFRGASSHNMRKFPADYPGAQRGQLSVNYRSSELIVNSFVEFATHMGASDPSFPLELTAYEKKPESRMETRVFNSLDDEAAGVAAAIRELEGDGIKLRDQAVLCRSNGRLNQIASALEARGVPVLHLGSLFEREEVRDLLSLLSLSVSPFGEGLVRLAAWPRYDFSLQDVYLLADRLHHSKDPAATQLTSLASTPNLSAKAVAALGQLAADLRTVSAHATAWEFLLTYLLDHTHAFADLARSEQISDRMKGIAIWQFLNFVREQPVAGSGSPIHRTLERVRQMVLLAEERDLRQVPAAALHMDAVRLMTVHGSKGLEFDAVHVPGMATSSFPTSDRYRPCLPPNGMIDDTEGLLPRDEAKRAHAVEEECLFFVAISRARRHVRLYRTNKTSDGRNRSPSSFLKWLPPQALSENLLPPCIPAPSGQGDRAFITVDWNQRQLLTDGRIKAYDGCPRRFFYTHVLHLGGARQQTAFTRTHDSLYELMRWLYGTRLKAHVSVEDAEREFERIWQERGPVTHAFAADYRALASRLIATLINWGADRKFRLTQSLAVKFRNGEILVEPHEMAELEDATVVLRHVHTGKQRSGEYDRIEYTLYVLAAEQHYPGTYLVEAIHLTDEATSAIQITAQKLANRREKLETVLKNILDGHFPMEIDAVRCPRCPHFFICPAAPTGTVKLV